MTPIPNLIRRNVRSRHPAAGLALAVLLALAGCAHDPATGPDPNAFGSADGQAIPGFPAFLTGPMGAILGQAGDFIGEITVEFQGGSGRAVPMNGLLLGRAGHLLYAPDPGTAGVPRGRWGRLSYYWDVSKASGYGISEALQGYGPCASSLRFAPRAGPNREQNQATRTWYGRRSVAWEEVVVSSEGTPHTFRVWRASDIKGFPVRIETVGGDRPLALGFKRVRIEVPADAAFRPPDGFTRFESLDMMLSELALRQRSLKRRPRDADSEPLPYDRPDARRL